MSGILDDLIKGDPLKGFEGLLESARIDPRDPGDKKPITVVLLIFVGASLSFAKTLYASANFSLLQHFAVTTILLAAAYITVGIILIFCRISSYESYSRVALTLFLCVIASSIFISVTLFFFGSVSPYLTDRIASLIDLIFGNQLTAPEWTLYAAPLLADVLTSFVYTFIGCLIVYLAVRAARRELPLTASRRLSARHRWFLFGYLVLTTITIYFLAIDRQNFFDNAMIQFSKIDMFH